VRWKCGAIHHGDTAGNDQRATLGESADEAGETCRQVIGRMSHEE
jgi:hypothetical protein